MACLPVLVIFLLFFMPETPYYLLLKKKDESAERALHWLRGKNFDIAPEKESIQSDIDKQQEVKSVQLKTLLTEGKYAKPFLMTCTLFLLQQLTGINAISFNLQLIFQQADTGLSPCIIVFLFN